MVTARAATAGAAALAGEPDEKATAEATRKVAVPADVDRGEKTATPAAQPVIAAICSRQR